MDQARVPVRGSLMPTLSGHLNLACACDEDGRSYLQRQSFSAPFHVSKPYWDGHVLLVQLSSPTPGLFSGDVLQGKITLDEGVRVCITTPSSSRAHAMNGTGAVFQQDFHVAGGATLEYCPALFIPQARSSYRQSTFIDVEKGGELLLFESIAPGRVAYGESFRYSEIDWECNVHYAGRLVLRERFVLDPGSSDFAAMKTPFPNGHYASACVISQAMEQDDAWVKDINAIHCEEIRIGASRLVDAGWSIKLLAEDSLALHRACHDLWQILARFFPLSWSRSRVFGFA